MNKLIKKQQRILINKDRNKNNLSNYISVNLINNKYLVIIST